MQCYYDLSYLTYSTHHYNLIGLSIVYSYMVLKLNKWGNSLGLRIPSALAASFKLVEGVTVSLEAMEEGIMIRPVKQQLDLEYLLTGLTEDNQHPELYQE